MGIKHAHPDLLDNGLAHMKANVNRIALISNYAKGDSYATVVARILAQIATTTAEFTLDSVGDDRRLTSPAKQANATATIAARTTDPNNDLHFAFLTADNRVLYVTDETTDMAVTSGNGINFPALPYTSKYPV
ncbi:hypothetical protein [Massilia sp.]|uniref:hypothetical protein n=1 Tax=Massilia sp. TaxID=1882437 RepID=UPI00289FD5D9|nr:hypothetical protein [Massilia sp.]